LHGKIFHKTKIHCVIIQIELKLLQESQAKTKEMEKLSQVLDKKGVKCKQKCHICFSFCRL